MDASGRHWSGAASGSANPAAVGITAAVSAAANFVTADINNDWKGDISDVQLIVNEALGTAQATHDLNNDGVVTIVDVQRLMNSVLNLY